MVNQTPSALYAVDYAREIKENSVRRNLLSWANNAAKLAYDRQKSIYESIPEITNNLYESIKSTGGAEHISIGLSKLFDDIYAKIADPKDVWGIPTGFATLDYVTGGLQKGSVLSIAGLPGLGKSLMAIQMGFYMAFQNRPGAIYELEMNQNMTLRRQVSVVSSVRARNMKTGRLQDGELAKIEDAVEKLSTLPIYLSNNTNWTTTTLRADLMTLKKVHGVEWFIVDYLKLLKDRFGGDEPERLGHVATLLHDIAQDLDLACVMVNSMTKEGMRDRVGITGMYGGAELGHSVDFALMLEPVDRENKPRLNNEPVAINGVIAKDREGDTGKTLIQFLRDANYPYFSEVANQYKMLGG